MSDYKLHMTSRDVLDFVESDKPSREVDCLIWAIINKKQFAYKEDALYVDNRKVGILSHGRRGKVFVRWGVFERTLPYYTSDIGAALDVIPPEWKYELVRMSNGWFRVLIRAQIHGGVSLLASKPGLKSRCAAVLSAVLQTYIP